MNILGQRMSFNAWEGTNDKNRTRLYWPRQPPSLPLEHWKLWRRALSTHVCFSPSRQLRQSLALCNGTGFIRKRRTEFPRKYLTDTLITRSLTQDAVKPEHANISNNKQQTVSRLLQFHAQYLYGRRQTE